MNDQILNEDIKINQEDTQEDVAVAVTDEEQEQFVEDTEDNTIDMSNDEVPND